MLKGQESFRVEIAALDDDTVVLDLFGELDLVTMSEFEIALDALRAAAPRHAVFDLSGADFVAGAAYEAIGRFSLDIECVTVCSKSGFAEKILSILGYDRIAFSATRWPSLAAGCRAKSVTHANGDRNYR